MQKIIKDFKEDVSIEKKLLSKEQTPQRAAELFNKKVELYFLKNPGADKSEITQFFTDLIQSLLDDAGDELANKLATVDEPKDGNVLRTMNRFQVALDKKIAATDQHLAGDQEERTKAEAEQQAKLQMDVEDDIELLRYEITALLNSSAVRGVENLELRYSDIKQQIEQTHKKLKRIPSTAAAIYDNRFRQLVDTFQTGAELEARNLPLVWSHAIRDQAEKAVVDDRSRAWGLKELFLGNTYAMEIETGQPLPLPQPMLLPQSFQGVEQFIHDRQLDLENLEVEASKHFNEHLGVMRLIAAQTSFDHLITTLLKLANTNKPLDTQLSGHLDAVRDFKSHVEKFNLVWEQPSISGVPGPKMHMPSYLEEKLYALARKHVTKVQTAAEITAERFKLRHFTTFSQLSHFFREELNWYPAINDTPARITADKIDIMGKNIRFSKAIDYEKLMTDFQLDEYGTDDFSSFPKFIHKVVEHDPRYIALKEIRTIPDDENAAQTVIERLQKAGKNYSYKSGNTEVFGDELAEEIKNQLRTWSTWARVKRNIKIRNIKIGVRLLPFRDITPEELDVKFALQFAFLPTEFQIRDKVLIGLKKILALKSEHKAVVLKASI